MLIPLTRETQEELVPAIATGPQYIHSWGRAADFLRKLLITAVALIALWLLSKVLGDGFAPIKLLLGIGAGTYWLWGPIYWTSLRNATYRRLPYCGFWRGRVLDVFITEELLREEQTVNKKGELVIVENMERRINVEVGDREGFRATLQAPIRKIYKGIATGQEAELILFSKDPELGRIDKISDLYLPQQDLWIGEYPCLRRDVFMQVSRELGDNRDRRPSKPKNRKTRF